MNLAKIRGFFIFHQALLEDLKTFFNLNTLKDCSKLKNREFLQTILRERYNTANYARYVTRAI